MDIAGGVTTLSYCWIITRRDAAVLGFTDHDEDVVVNGITCAATTGITTTKIKLSMGLSANDLEVEGVLDDEVLRAEDMAAGLYDHARVDIYLVDWSDPSQKRHLASGEFGNVVEGDGGKFTVEFLSRAAQLSQVSGRTYQRTCDVRLGSVKCGVNLTNPAYRKSASVVSVSGPNVALTDLSSHAEGWFNLGTLITSDGAELPIRSHSGNTVTLWSQPLVAPVGTVTLVAGCNKSTTQCDSKFGNIVNFQGFPFIPTNDTLGSYPVRGTATFDGGSLFA